jgi:Ca2+:H+ antiporter
VPIGIALEYAHVNKVAVFVVNFVAIIPLAAILSFATEELALYIGEVLGGLLNASFGNAVELIVGIIALVQGKVVIVQTSLVGSMLSNLLLVLGMCFFLGGINRTEQHFNLTVAQTAASLLALAIGSLIIPTAFAQFASTGDVGVTPTSRGTCVLLLVVYGCYLLFQLRTHTLMYNEPSKKTPKRSTGKRDAGEAAKGIAMIGAASGAATAGGRINQANIVHEEPEEEETPSVSIIGSLVTLLIATVFIALCAEYMVSSIDAITRNGGVSEEFVGLILLPIVGNAAEHATAVTVAIKDKMDLSIGVAVGSSLQIALLVLPIMVMLSWWGVGPETLDLNFDGFLGKWYSVAGNEMSCADFL